MSTDRKISTISIIIPTRNEAANISKLLPDILAIPGIEVLVVDGGSTDNTAAIADTLGAKVLHAPIGRASQMNVGARAAASDILLFLHADTRLPPDFAGQVRHAVCQPGIAAGAFQLAIDGRGIGLRMIAWLANLRTRMLQLPYGDQGIFVRTEIFSAVEGFPDLPIMEDFELVRQLKRKGRIRILPLPATTSSRRWKKYGVLRTTLIHQAIIIGYLLGVNRHTLAKWHAGR